MISYTDDILSQLSSIDATLDTILGLLEKIIELLQATHANTIHISEQLSDLESSVEDIRWSL